MKTSAFLAIAFLLSITFLRCKKNDIPTNTTSNKPPSEFSITLNKLSRDTAKISWTKAIDPNNDEVFYKILLNDSLVVSNYKEFDFTFKNLKELTAYTIKIVASNSKQKETSRTLIFTTEKYFVKFLKKIEYGLISGNSVQGTGQMIKANDGGYIITGKTELLIQVGEPVKFFAVKIDTLGNEVWKKYYNYNPWSSNEIKIHSCIDGYLISGDRNLLKIDNNGNLIWHRPSFSVDEIINAAGINSYGEIYTVGHVAGDFTTNIVEASISKYDQNGNIIWNKKFSPSIFDQFYDIKVISNDQIILLGLTDGNNITMDDYLSGNGHTNADFWVAKLTGEGDLTWSKTYHDIGDAFPENIIQTREGNYVFTGFSLGTMVIPYLYLQMIDPNGESIWVNTSLDNRTMAYSVAETNDNALIVTGGYRGGMSTDFSLYKFDKSGNQLWGKLYNEGFANFINKTVIPTNDGGYMINSQKFTTYNVGSETDQIYIFKTDGNGEFK